MRTQVIITLLTGMLENLFFAGILYGWPSLEYVLLKERYFHDMCTNQTSFLKACPQQAATLNLVFYLGTVLSYFVLLPFGWAMDKYGTWKTRSVGVSAFTLGVTCLLISSPALPWFIFPGLILVATGGMSFLVSNPQTANFFPKVRAILINLFDGLYMSSTCVFLFVKLAYDAGANLRAIFGFLLAMSLFPWMRTFTLMPKKTFPFPVKDPDAPYGIYEWSNGGSINDVTKPLVTSQTQVRETSANLKNPLVWSVMLQVGILSLRCVFFEGSLVSWLTTFESDPETVSYLVNVYGVFMLCSFAFAVPTGSVIDCITNFLKGENSLFYGLLANMLLTSGLFILLSVAVIAQWPITAFWSSTVAQVSVFGGATTFIASAFPMDDFGKLFGYIGICGVLFLLLEVALYQLSLVFDPSFLVVNYVLLASCILTLFHPILWLKLGKKNLKLLHPREVSNGM